MAGPGGGRSGGGFGGGSFGGSRGGGFSSGGGFSGGSFGGGSFGGGHHHRPPHHHHHGPHWHGPYWRGSRFGYGGGCGGGIVVLAIVLLLFFAFITIYKVNVSDVAVSYEDEIFYDEVVMQDYANEKYMQYFGSSSAVEDNILLVFLTNEEGNGYYTIAWVGDNIKYDINCMFGEYSEYGNAMFQYINTEYFGYSLDMSYAMVIKEMTSKVVDLGLSSNFYAESDKSNLAQSKLVNFTEFDLSDGIVNPVLESFTAQTGIPCVLVVDYAERVFNSADFQPGEKDMTTQEAALPQSTHISFIIIACVIGIIIVATIIIFAVNKNKKTKAKKKDDSLPWEG